MKRVRFASLSHDVIETKSLEADIEIDENSRWWSRADRMANKRDLIQILTCEGLNLVKESYSLCVLEAFRTIQNGGRLSLPQKIEFFVEVSKENSNRGIEKYLLIEFRQSYHFRRNRLQALIFALQDSQVSMGLDKNQKTDLIRVMCEKYSEGARAMAYLFGQADEFAVKNEAANDVATLSDAKLTITKNGSTMISVLHEAS
jgi:hypothetical protein